VAWAPDRLLGEAPWREQPSPGQPAGTAAAQSCLADYAAASPLQVLRRLDSTWRGLDEAEAQARLTRLGDNAIAAGRPPHWSTRVLAAARNPFVVILICLSVVSTATGDLAGAAVIAAMVVTSCALRVPGVPLGPGCRGPAGDGGDHRHGHPPRIGRLSACLPRGTRRSARAGRRCPAGGG